MKAFLLGEIALIFGIPALLVFGFDMHHTSAGIAYFLWCAAMLACNGFVRLIARINTIFFDGFFS